MKLTDRLEVEHGVFPLRASLTERSRVAAKLARWAPGSPLPGAVPGQFARWPGVCSF
jgi:hypothetical protein